MKILTIVLFAFVFAIMPTEKGHTQSHPDIHAEVIGRTYFDLQTNATMARRIVLHHDGTVSAVWTMSHADNLAHADRGTGYNHFDGNEWTPFYEIQNRLEDDRTGWPNIGVLSGNREYILSHYAGDAAGVAGFALLTNQEIGSTDFDQKTILTSSDDVPEVGPTWAQVAESEGYLHIIGNYSDQTVGEVYIDSVLNPMVYSKYNYEEDTFYYKNILLPGFDTSRYRRGNADRYSIDAQGSNVAILVGRVYREVALWESDDHGETWTLTIVDSLRDDFTEGIADEADTAAANDGSVNVIIDENGVVHDFWGLTGIRREIGSEVSFVERTGNNGISYWNSSDREVQKIATIIDRDGSGTVDIAREVNSTRSTNDQGETQEHYHSYGNTGLVTMPTASTDADGNIYVTYKSILEGARYLNSTFMEYFHDIYVVYSTDGGITWSEPQNLTNDWETENAFPSQSRFVDDHLHIVYQEGLFPASASTTNSLFSLAEKDIVYLTVPIQAILNDEIGQGTMVSIDDLSKASDFDRVSTYPNPFSNDLNVNVSLKKNSNVTVEVYNTVGQKIAVEHKGSLSQGEHSVHLNTEEWNAGIYIVKVSTDNGSQSLKMIKN